VGDLLDAVGWCVGMRGVGVGRLVVRDPWMDGVRVWMSLAGQWYDVRVYTSHNMHVRRQETNCRQLQWQTKWMLIPCSNQVVIRAERYCGPSTEINAKNNASDELPWLPSHYPSALRLSLGSPSAALFPRPRSLHPLPLSRCALQAVSLPLMLAQLVSSFEGCHASEDTPRLHARIVPREVQRHMSLQLMWAIEPGIGDAAWETAFQDLGLLPAAWDAVNARADYDGSCVGYCGGDGIGIDKRWWSVALERVRAVGFIVVLSKPRCGRVVGECCPIWSTGNVADNEAELVAAGNATMFTTGRRLVHGLEQEVKPK